MREQKWQDQLSLRELIHFNFYQKGKEILEDLYCNRKILFCNTRI